MPSYPKPLKNTLVYGSYFLKLKNYNENKIAEDYNLNVCLHPFQIYCYSEVLHLDIFSSYLTTQLQATVIIPFIIIAIIIPAIYIAEYSA